MIHRGYFLDTEPQLKSAYNTPGSAVTLPPPPPPLRRKVGRTCCKWKWCQPRLTGSTCFGSTRMTPIMTPTTPPGVLAAVPPRAPKVQKTTRLLYRHPELRAPPQLPGQLKKRVNFSNTFGWTSNKKFCFSTR